MSDDVCPVCGEPMPRCKCTIGDLLAHYAAVMRRIMAG